MAALKKPPPPVGWKACWWQLVMAGLCGVVIKTLLSVGKVFWWQLAMAGPSGVVMKDVSLCLQR